MARPTARRRSTRRPGLRTILIVAAVVVVLGALGWLVGFSSVLAVRNVSIVGEQVLSADEVRSTAQVPLGVPLARLDTDQIGERVGALRPVRSVKVSRAWPDTVRIEVAERVPRFVAQTAGRYTLVDETGLGYAPTGEVPDGLVVARNVPEGEWPDVATVIGALPDTVAERAETVTTRGPSAIVIHLDGEVVVEWGSADESADKALVLSALMTAAPDAKVYNVSAPKHPTTR